MPLLRSAQVMLPRPVWRRRDFDGSPGGNTSGETLFYEGQSQKVGEAAMQHVDLELLKALIVLRQRLMDEPKP